MIKKGYIVAGTPAYCRGIAGFGTVAGTTQKLRIGRERRCEP